MRYTRIKPASGRHTNFRPAKVRRHEKINSVYWNPTLSTLSFHCHHSRFRRGGDQATIYRVAIQLSWHNRRYPDRHDFDPGRQSAPWQIYWETSHGNIFLCQMAEGY